MLVIIVAVLLSIFIGVALGLVSGYLGGWLDRTLVVIADAIFAFPSLLLAIVVSIVISGGRSSLWAGLLSAGLSITVIFIPQYFRVIRAEAVRIKSEAFVESAMVVVSSVWRIMFVHVLRNATRTLPLIFTLNASRRSSPSPAWASLASASNPRRRPSGATTSTAPSPTSERYLVDCGVSGHGDRAVGSGHHPCRRESQRPRRPETPPSTEGGLMSKDAVQITDLSVTFATDGGDIEAVRGVNLSVASGRVLAIVGESGSGKTVTAKTILGLLPETATARGAVVITGTRHSGESIDVVGLSTTDLRQIRGREVSMVFQEPSTALNPVYTVGWQIAEGIQAHGGVSKSEARAMAIEILDRVGIPDPKTRVDYYPHQFSGGQKQRVVIGMALVMNPGTPSSPTSRPRPST